MYGLNICFVFVIWLLFECMKIEIVVCVWCCFYFYLFKFCQIFIDFFATWCGPCVRIGPYVEKCAKDDKYKDIAFVKVDVDKCSDTSSEYKIQAMPTFILLDKEHKQAKMGRGGAEQVVNDVLAAAK